MNKQEIKLMKIVISLIATIIILSVLVGEHYDLLKLIITLIIGVTIVRYAWPYTGYAVAVYMLFHIPDIRDTPLAALTLGDIGNVIFTFIEIAVICWLNSLFLEHRESKIIAKEKREQQFLNSSPQPVTDI